MSTAVLTTSRTTSQTSCRELDTRAAADWLTRHGLPSTPRFLEELRQSGDDRLPVRYGPRSVALYRIADLDALVRRLLRIPEHLDLDNLPLLGGFKLICAESAVEVICIRARSIDAKCSLATLKRRRALGQAPPWLDWNGRVWYRLHEVRAFADEMTRARAADGFEDDPDPWEWAAERIAA